MRIFVLSLLVFRTLMAIETRVPDNFLDPVYRGVTYFCAGSIFETGFLLARLGWGLCHVLPQKAVTEKECWLFSNICSQAARLAYTAPCNQRDWCRTWLQNRQLLTQVPIVSQDDDHLLHFLQDRWMTKMAGISRIGLEWVYPCFGFAMQANPTSNHAYARLPSSHMTEVYKKRMQTWQQEFDSACPLILTRSADIGRFLPTYFSLEQIGSLEAIINQLPAKAIVDCTELLSLNDTIHANWESRFSKACSARGLNIDQIICIQRVQGEGIGGIRILSLPGQSLGAATKQHDCLLECISTLGLAANRIELDREPVLQEVIPFPKNKEIFGCVKASNFHDRKQHCITPYNVGKVPDRRAFLSTLASLEARCAHVPDHKKILIDATFQVLKSLFNQLTEQEWQNILASPARSFVTWLSMVKIKKQLQLISDHLAKPLFEIALALEQVHADLSAVLEVLTPFTPKDFSQIFLDLIALPEPLRPLTSYGIHHSGMTCFASIVKAVEKEAGSVHAIYGENSFFECVKVFEKLALPFSRADRATEEEWQRANLLLVQFNPAVQTDLHHEEYRLENIEGIIRKALASRKGANLTLALDTTLDYIKSPKVEKILEIFSKEILEGVLTVVVFRSGNKFDLLGMDNYSGAPFYLIRNNKPSFDFLLTDSALQCDRLSLNWFCLAYQSIAPQLEQYTKQIFANTRSLLDKVPKTLENKSSRYRVVPMASEADSAFIDIKVAGPFQKIKTAALVLPYLFLESLKKQQPIFNRPSLGFYHPNINVIFGEECSTIRLTLGLDPKQIDVFTKCFEILGTLDL